MENGVATQTKIARISRWRGAVSAASIGLTRNAHPKPRNVKIMHLVRIYFWNQYSTYFIIVIICFVISNQISTFSSDHKVSPPDPEIDNCKDKGKHCKYWKKQGYCTKDHVRYMKTNCKKSCSFCDAVWYWMKRTSKTLYCLFLILIDSSNIYEWCTRLVIAWWVLRFKPFSISCFYHVTTICNKTYCE